MPLSIRLDEELEHKLRLILQREGIGLSEFVREAIREKLAKEAEQQSPYELGKHLFGRYGSSNSQQSNKRKELIRDKIRAKHCN